MNENLSVHVFIDRGSDTVYGSETSQHKLSKRNSNRGRLASFASELRDLNQIALLRNRLDTGKHLILQTAPQKTAVGTSDEVNYSDHHIVIGDVAASLGSRKQRIYTNEPLMPRVFP